MKPLNKLLLKMVLPLLVLLAAVAANAAGARAYSFRTAQRLGKFRPGRDRGQHRR